MSAVRGRGPRRAGRPPAGGAGAWKVTTKSAMGRERKLGVFSSKIVFFSLGAISAIEERNQLPRATAISSLFPLSLFSSFRPTIQLLIHRDT